MKGHGSVNVPNVTGTLWRDGLCIRTCCFPLPVVLVGACQGLSVASGAVTICLPQMCWTITLSIVKTCTWDLCLECLALCKFHISKWAQLILRSCVQFLASTSDIFFAYIMDLSVGDLLWDLAVEWLWMWKHNGRHTGVCTCPSSCCLEGFSSTSARHCPLSGPCPDVTPLERCFQTLRLKAPHLHCSIASPCLFLP